MEQYGVLVVTCFVASWNNPAQGRGVVVARIRTTADKAPEVFAGWVANNAALGARATYNSPFEACFQPDSFPVCLA